MVLFVSGLVDSCHWFNIRGGMMKNIVFCSDGTRNTPKNRTNVLKIPGKGRTINTPGIILETFDGGTCELM